MNPLAWYRRQRLSRKLLVALVGVNAALALVYTVYDLRMQQAIIERDLDAKLLSVAAGAAAIAEPVHERDLLKEPLSEAEHRPTLLRLNRFAKEAGVKYVYTTVGTPEKVLFGTDGPWLHPAVEFAKVRALRLPPEDKALVLGGNFLRLTAACRRFRPAFARAERRAAVAAPGP